MIQALQILEREREDKAKEAIRLTCELYGIHPTGLYDSKGNPRKPLVTDFTTAEVPRHEWLDSSGQPQAQSVNAGTTHLGVTWGDGTITVTLYAFASPGILAGALVHERVHVDQDANGTGVRMSPIERERAAREAVLTDKTKAALGYTPDDVKFLEDAAKRFLKRPQDFLPIPAQPGQKPPGVRGFDEFGIDSELLAELHDRSNDLRRSVATESAQRSRQVIDRVKEDNPEVGAAFRADAASRCNLMPVDPVNDAFKVRVGRGESVILRYEDEDGFNAALLLVYACTVPWVPNACNSGMDAINRRWGDKEFRKSVILAVGSDQKLINCLWHMHHKLKSPNDYQEVRRVSEEFHESARGNDPPSTTEAPPAQPRPPREEPGDGSSPPARPRCRFMGPWCE